MDKFAIKGEFGFIKITLDKVFGFPEDTCYWGGYDALTTLEIESGNFRVKSNMYNSTGGLFEFLQKLKECNNNLTGTAVFTSYERDLTIQATYDRLGHVIISVKYSDQNNFGNYIELGFPTDQTFIKYTIEELELIAIKYGDMKGIKK